MTSDAKDRFVRVLASFILAAVLAAGTALVLRGAPRSSSGRSAAQQSAPPSSGPEIPASQLIQPDELAKELTGKSKPVVVCVAPRFLYDGAHIPGALFHGPDSRPEGIADLRQWAQDFPRDSYIVLYCGCCPMVKCPNVRPALAALQQMGFTRAKVLSIPTNFNTDWVEKGYPIEKSH